MTLLEHLANDRYGAEYADNPTARTWNSAIDHAINLVRIHMGLVEVREARAMDLRVKHELTGVP